MKISLKKKVMSITAVSTIMIGTLVGAYWYSSSVKAKPHQSNGKVKNVIFMIPDGYSASYATSYRWYKGEESAMDPLLVGMHRTYSADTEVTDSAAAGTAMATGVKTNNGMISTSPKGKKLKTILQAAEAAGKSSGLIATSTITHATPAVFASHVASRADEANIAPQLLENDVDVILGGGKKYFPSSLLKQAEKNGYKIVSDRYDLNKNNKANKMIGLFAEEGMAAELDRDKTNQPSLAEMTDSALKILNKNKDGFFLMVEGSQIDWAGHAHDAAWAMKDSQAFEEAVEKALDFAKKDKETLIVIASDHDTGGMSVGGYGEYDAKIEVLRDVTATGDFMASQINANKSNIKEVVKKYTSIELTNNEIEKVKTADKPNIAINEIVSEHALVGWTSIQHTGVDVPLYAFGPSADLFTGLHENTELPGLMAKAMQIKFKQTE